MDRVVILALGSRGDVEPCVALAKALRQDGYDVVIHALDDFRDIVDRGGIDFVSMRASLPRPGRASRQLDWAMRHAHRHPSVAVAGVGLWLRGVATDIARSVTRQVRPTDTVISGILTLDTALALRAALGCRIALALFAPCLPTRDGPSLIQPLRPARASVLNRAGGTLAWAAGVWWSRPVGAVARRELGLPGRRTERSFLAPPDVPVLLAVSPLLVPAAADWGPGVRLTGPWHMPAPDDHNVPDDQNVPEDLMRFLDDGPAPVFASFGSVGLLSDIPLFVEAAAAAGVRLVTTVPRGFGTAPGRIGATAYAVDEVPHAWLLPRTAGVVHHGGAGTTTTALRAGVPSTAVPHQFDQHYYARRLALLGVGPAPAPRRELDSAGLARMMTAMTRAPEAAEYRQRAIRTSVEAARERGTEEAMRVLRTARLI
ncbi:nucleotide disphospho-sugar-binding domain-containing protein [Streptomyces sp. NPDC047017]|uniref:glycosyltransferase n=1 Tax=Streptomyces sp. NPDC047017 TaxID=3155024 RepID=UPI0033DD4144